jgi:hypothetical protein
MKLTINENPNTRAKRALFGDSTGKIKNFAILSPENPMGKKLSYNENRERIKAFRNDLNKRAIQFTRITGSYGNKEHSFMLFNLNYAEAEELASKYEQESFFYGTNAIPSKISYYQTFDDGKTYKLIETSDKINNMNDAEDYFSRIGDLQFSVNMKVFESISNAILDESENNIAMEDNRTTFSRMIHRKIANGIIRKD